MTILSRFQSVSTFRIILVVQHCTRFYYNALICQSSAQIYLSLTAIRSLAYTSSFYIIRLNREH